MVAALLQACRNIHQLEEIYGHAGSSSMLDLLVANLFFG
ncbi:hypothetical protein RAMDARK_1195 [Rickettsia amblyommatis str. Darkwater]|nr:hypothetical protein RAMDARK_1195 [Rickettsia amblyommatis str. Darkwater]